MRGPGETAVPLESEAPERARKGKGKHTAAFIAIDIVFPEGKGREKERCGRKQRKEKRKRAAKETRETDG